MNDGMNSTCAVRGAYGDHITSSKGDFDGIKPNATVLPPRHCEEQSDEAIQCGTSALDCFASLAMTIDRDRQHKVRDKPGDDD
jgi:hypothetical protein